MNVTTTSERFTLHGDEDVALTSVAPSIPERRVVSRASSWKMTQRAFTVFPPLILAGILFWPGISVQPMGKFQV